MLRGARGECAADLSVQSSAHPKAAGLVQEIGHLRRQSPESRAGYNDDGVVSCKVVDLRDWRGLIDLVVRLARDLVGYELGNAFDVDLRAGFPGSFSDGRRHGFDMTV